MIYDSKKRDRANAATNLFGAAVIAGQDIAAAAARLSQCTVMDRTDAYPPLISEIEDAANRALEAVAAYRKAVK